MVPLTRPLLARWHEAEALANEADRFNFAEAIAFMEGTGMAPAQCQWDSARTLRLQANALFKLAIVVDPRRLPA